MNISSSLTTLSLNFYHLRGKLKNNILSLPSIQTLDLWANDNLDLGSLPKCNWSSSFLMFLDLYLTRLSGELPDSIGNLKSLKHLNLYHCNLTGSIPTSLGNLIQITYLNLNENKFVGSIPTSLGNLTKLTILDLSYNIFSHEILLPLSNFRCFWHTYELTNFNYWGIFQQVCYRCHYLAYPISQVYSLKTINLLVPFPIM